jgi:predicted acylesterase/phospholipase RssA
MKHSHKSTFYPAPAAPEKSYPALVVLEEQRGLSAPLGEITSLLAQAIVADFGDDVIIVHIVDAEPTSRRDPVIRGSRGLDEVWLNAPADLAETFELVVSKLANLGDRYSYVFLDASLRPPDFTRFLVARLSTSDLRDMVLRLVFLTKDHAAPHFSPGWSVLRTDLLACRSKDHFARKERHSRESWRLRDYINEARDVTSGLYARLGGAAIEPQGEAYPFARVKPDWCRVRLDLSALASGKIRNLSDLPHDMREAFSRWGRALTRRRVGIALGGSGSWGYAHVALMQELGANRVPIDLIGGSSSGSLMGAYYAVLGQDGLELAIRRGERFSRMALMSTVSTTIIDVVTDADFGPVLLEDLDVVFLPVATNLSYARAEVITRSTVGSAVRASSSAPGFFASTITRAGLYVDGAITDNVPVVLVERMGADLLLAVNSLPPPTCVNVEMPTSPLQDFVAEFHPWNRIRDLAVSFSLMFHDFGECEDAETRIIYEPPPQLSPLFRTFEFHRAEEIVAHVKHEEQFQDMVRKSMEAWHKLSQPRHGRGVRL